MSTPEIAARASMTAGVDPFVFEIIRHKLFRVTEEAAIALENASGTSITTEGHDLMVSLYRANGSLMVGGSGFIQHITSASQAVKHVLALFSDSPGFHEDDVYLFNDPYSGALHAPDIYLIAPIHSDGELAGFVAGFVHVHDIGGIDPGGFCPSARSSFQEGFATQGIKLVERGSTRPDVLGTFLNMVRDPSIVALDVKSLLAAIHVAKERMRSLYRTYGVQTVESVSSALVEQSEHLFRGRLTELPNGCWRARTYYEQPDRAMRIHLAMTKQGDTVTFDFSGTDEQVPFGVNCSYWATWGSLFASLFVLVVPDLVWNDGIIAPVRLIAPEGTLINARRPAPVSMATIAMVQTVRNLSVLVISKMLGASTSLRHQATGSWAPTNVTYHLSDLGDGATEHGTDVYAGSGGALATRDGLDLGGQIHALASRWANLERHEAGFPYRYLYRRLVTDSGGPGKYRGGMCHEYALVGHGSAGQLEAVLMPGRGGQAPLSHGVFGGYPGCNTASIRFRESNKDDWPHDLASTSGRHQDQLGMGITQLGSDDVLYIRHDGAGGYGDPLERDPGAVLRDVLAGLVSEEAAVSVYGVVLDPERQRVDDDATAERRLAARKLRVGGAGVSDSAASPQPVTTTQKRVNEYLQVRDDGQTAVVECRWCGATICDTQSHWKEHVVMRRSAPAVAGPLRSQEGPFFLLEFFCPGCGTLLEVESAFEDDPPLHDTIDDWGVAPG
jgi:N-methylhydantoinase B